MKCKMMITLTEKAKKILKEHSEEIGISMSGIIGLAIMEYIPKQEAEKPKKPRVRQCSVVSCMKPYDTNEYDSCPDCGNKNLYNNIV